MGLIKKKWDRFREKAMSELFFHAKKLSIHGVVVWKVTLCVLLNKKDIWGWGFYLLNKSRDQNLNVETYNI